MSAYTQLQKELCSTVRHSLHNSQQLQAFKEELTVKSGETEEEICANAERQFTFAVPVDEESSGEYLIYLKATVFKQSICSWFGEVKDCVIGKVVKESSGEPKFIHIG